MLKEIPVDFKVETIPVLKKLAEAHRYLAELKGVSETIPNQAILINTLSLQEAKDSSEIENIVTTHDELYKANILLNQTSSAAKEVRNYASALIVGYNHIKQTGLLTVNSIINIQQILEQNNAGIRKLPGTELKNDITGHTVYVPPQEYQAIKKLMKNLEIVINDDNYMGDMDYLTKMAVIHLQFESIHPFYDGNGRTGRIINVLYLVQKELLNIPVLYLSRYIIHHKSDYYRLLQKVRTEESWEEWILYMLQAVVETSKETAVTVKLIKKVLLEYKHKIRSKYNFYSQDLINNLFIHPYTKIEALQSNLNISRNTAAKYLNALTEGGFLTKHKLGRSNYYVNNALWSILTTNTSANQ
jgi:cell filamentation protein, protein adenylyltransferase